MSNSLKLSVWTWLTCLLALTASGCAPVASVRGGGKASEYERSLHYQTVKCADQWREILWSWSPNGEASLNPENLRAELARSQSGKLGELVEQVRKSQPVSTPSWDGRFAFPFSREMVDPVFYSFAKIAKSYVTPECQSTAFMVAELVGEEIYSPSSRSGFRRLDISAADPERRNQRKVGEWVFNLLFHPNVADDRNK